MVIQRKLDRPSLVMILQYMVCDAIHLLGGHECLLRKSIKKLQHVCQFESFSCRPS
jgi:hypothetical protein